MGLKVGDRVQLDRDAKRTENTQGHEVLLRGHTGTVLVPKVEQIPFAVVEWDAGTYEVFAEIVRTPTGFEAVSSGTVELESFEATVHRDIIQGTLESE
jgi:hypothetical protein